MAEKAQRGSRAGETTRARTARSNGARGRRAPKDEPIHDVCPVAFCPICTAVSAVNRASPEVVQHLLLAGQQFLMALKAVVDARAADFEEAAEEQAPPMERIDIG